MRPFRLPWGLLAEGSLWVVAAASVFLLLTQIIMVMATPQGYLRWPAIAKVTVQEVERDQDGKITGRVLATEEGKDRWLRMSKGEAFELKQDEEVWILENFLAGGFLNDEFRLTPWRLMEQFAVLPMALALAGIALLRRLGRRAEVRAEQQAPPRKVWKDEFHQRAERHAAPKEPGEPGA